MCIRDRAGGIVQQEGPIDVSNVMYVHKGAATRVGFKMDGEVVYKRQVETCCAQGSGGCGAQGNSKAGRTEYH